MLGAEASYRFYSDMTPVFRLLSFSSRYVILALNLEAPDLFHYAKSGSHTKSPLTSQPTPRFSSYGTENKMNTSLPSPHLLVLSW
jgi:hypothetical protein